MLPRVNRLAPAFVALAVLVAGCSSKSEKSAAPKKKVLQAGPMILDDQGNVVWFHPLDTHGVSDFRVQRYNGKPVLTWWRGQAPMGVGTGRYVITRRNTALFPIYHQV